MSDDLHPDAGTLARYVRGETGRLESRELELHLSGCTACQAAVDKIPLETGRGGVVRWQGHRFEERRVQSEREEERRQMREERRQNLEEVMHGLGSVIGAIAEKELAELLREPELGRRALIRKEEKFHSMHLCELLEARCRQAWFTDPAEAVEYAKLAALIAERLPAEAYGSNPVKSARIMAWRHLGNSYRIAADWRRTRRFEVAERAEDDDSTSARPAWTLGEGGSSYEAEVALWELRDAFLELGMGFDALLVTLDLAIAFLKQGREEELRRLVDEGVALFEERGVQPYTLDAMRFLRDSSARQGLPLTVELLEKMATFLQRVRNDPAHRFRAEG
ncbi:MAG TPA: hypothetical protein VF756_15675 [Thermoanaerobaculia bacterium]